MPIPAMPPLPENILPSALLVLGWLGLLRLARYSSWSLALFSLFGTALHESLHFLVGLLLGAKPVAVSLWPKRRGQQWVLGSVSFTGLNLLNSAPVAFAPLLLLGLAWLLVQYWLQPALLSGQYLSWGLAGYAVAACLFSCLPSGADIRIGALSAVLWCAIAYGVWRASLRW